jgi:hypothetical protein
MDILAIVLVIIGAIVVFGILGLLIKFGGFILNLLLDGCSSSIGCLAWIIALIIFFTILI